MDTLQCKTCGAIIPDGARFCGRCGKYIDADQVETRPLSTDYDTATMFTGDLSTVEDGWNWQPVEQDAPAPFALEVALPPLLGADIGPSPASVPVVQGYPQMGSVPSLQGTPQMPGGAALHAPAPLQQAPAGTGATSAAPEAPPVSSRHIPQHHQRRRWFRKRRKEEPRHQHQPSHHLHHSGPLHHSGALHTHSQTLSERTGRMARKSLKHAGRWHPRAVLMATISIVVIGALSALFLLPLLRSHAQPAATLLLNGSIVPGGNIAIQGRNFTPGGTITFTIDGRTASPASTSPVTQVQGLPASASASQASLAQLMQQATKSQARGSSIVVQADGSFETTIQIGPNWPVGSSHVLIATEQSSGQQARLSIVIPHPAQLTSCASATTVTSIVLGPVTEGQAQPVSTGFTLCTQGSGIVQWTVGWNQQQAKWLQIEQSGNIQAPLSKQVTIGASANGLKAGSYTTIVTFTDQHGLKVALQVTLLVRPAGATACLNTSQQSLTFSATLGLASPAAQQVTLTNCGVSGSWTAITHTDDGAHWLSASPTGGQLKAQASSAVSVAVASSALAQGTYTGQVTMKMGAGLAVVNVTLNVQPSPKSPPCISVTPQSLTFSATQGQGNPAAQSVTVGNCGPAAGWSASTAAGANWLTVSPAKGNLSANASANVSIAVSGAGLQSGTYTGQVTFTMGSSTQSVSVSFTIVQQQPKPCLQVSSTSLPFTATQGQGDPVPQAVTLTNCGPGGSWSASTVNNSPWLAVNPASSALSAGAAQSVTVNVSIAGLRAGTYSDSIDFALLTSAGGTRQTVTVTLNVQPPPPPCLQASPASLTFSATIGQSDPTPQAVTLTNCGTDGSWSASTANSSSWLSMTPTSGSLSAATSQSVTVSTSIIDLSPGTYNDTIIFTLTNSGGTAQQSVAISLNVLPAPCLSITSTTPQASSGVIYIYAGSTASVTVSNCTGDTGTLSSSDGAGWLKDDVQQGTSIGSGGTQTITISTASSAPAGGTGTVTITLMTRGGQAPVTVTIGILYPIQ